MGFRSDIERIFACGIFVVCLLILLVMGWFTVRMLYVDQFVIPTNSMCPTLQPGDRVIVDKTIFMHSRTLRLTTILKKL